MGRVRNQAVAQRWAWLHGREGDAWVMLAALAVGALTVIALQAVAGAMAAAPQRAAPQSAASAHLPPGAVLAHERIFHLPQANPALMIPVVDQQGRIWVGEMAENKLAMLDPRTGAVKAWTPPGGQFNIMGEVVDSQGNVWFTEEAAGYIGRFDPTTETFQTYPLAQINGQAAGPEAIAMDSHGRIWFTEVTGEAIGVLDPATGAITNYPLPAASGGAPIYPYALAITADGVAWFGGLSGGVIGKVDPTTGKVTTYSVNDPKAQIYSMSVGPDGALWFVELQSASFGRIDPQTGQVSMTTAPATLGNPATLYNVVAHGDSLWFTSTGANALLRYTPATGKFLYYQLATPSSVPFGLTVAPDGALWFSADGAPNYIGKVQP